MTGITPIRGLVSLLTIALTLAVASTARAAPPPPVQSALAMLKQGTGELARHWRYEETIKSPQGKMRLAHDPSGEPDRRWTIITINGKPPSEAEQKRLSAQAARTAKTATGKGLEIGSGWLAASDYRLVKRTEDRLIYQLRPRPAEGADQATTKLLSHLAGRFVITRGSHRPLSLRLDNFESFSPRFGVEVKAFAFRVKFERLGKSGPVVVVRTSNSVSGEVFWVKDFKDETRVILSNFSLVPPPQTSQGAAASSP